MLPIRLAAAATLAAAAGFHLYLWWHGYRDIDLIGPAFLVNAIAGFVLVAAMFARGRLVAIAAAAAAVFTAGSFLALVLSLTIGLFGFYETVSAPLVVPTLVVEGVGVLLQAAFAVMAWKGAGGTSRGQSRPRPVRHRP